MPANSATIAAERASHTTGAPAPIIVDTDPGVDDAMAILLALASPEVEVLGLTTVFGNSDDLELLTTNALMLTELAGHAQVPVARGSAHPLTRQYSGRAHLVHGSNALGDVELPAPQAAPDPRFGPQFIVDACLARPGQVTLVAVGPLTNLALALRIRPDLPDFVQRVAIMGGATRGSGNVSPTAEFNIFADAEAARLVFAAGWPVTLAGLDVTRQVMVAEPFLQSLAALGNRCGRFLHDAAQHYLAYYRSKGNAGLAMHDVHAVMPLLRPSLYTTSQVFVDVETRGELTRGQTVADWRNILEKPAQTTVLMSVDEAAFLDEYRTRIAALP